MLYVQFHLIFLSFQSIFFPVSLFDLIFASECGQDAVLPVRLFGAAVTCKLSLSQFLYF